MAGHCPSACRRHLPESPKWCSGQDSPRQTARPGTVPLAMSLAVSRRSNKRPDSAGPYRRPGLAMTQPDRLVTIKGDGQIAQRRTRPLSDPSPVRQIALGRSPDGAVTGLSERRGTVNSAQYDAGAARCRR